MRSSLISFFLLALTATQNALADREFASLAATPYPAQHANPRNSDYTPYTSPTELKLKWKALEDSSIVQGCTTDRGQLYCVRGWDTTTDKCNLIALSEVDGSTLWEDRVGGKCLLDEYASLTNPTIDVDGNLYINDSKKIVSFSPDGQLRWINETPASLVSRKGLSNAPFGLVLLSGGEIATATLGDGWILFLDSQTGELTRELFDLPAEKRKLEKTTRMLLPDSRPEGFMENLMSPTAAQLLWDFAFGESDFETDNNIAVAEKHSLLFISSGAPYPNEANTGALWAISYAKKGLEVAFYVALDVEGGIATSPTINRENSLALIGDNDRNLVTVDIERCLQEASGGACQHYSKHPIGHDLTSSVIITDQNRLIIPSGKTSYAAYDLDIDDDGHTNLQQVWETALAWFPIGVSVHLAFDNVVWIPFYHIARQQPFIVALDVDSGEEVARYESGDAANVTMASDGETMVANIMSFIETNFLGRWGFEVKGGVWAWEAVK
jgi:PQQ-like domain